MIKQISHLGFAVNDLEKSRDFYRTVFGLQSSDPIIAGDGSLRVSMVHVGNAVIELLEPIGDQSVIAKFLKKKGEGFHHICYNVDDIHAEIENVKSKGLEVLGEPKPGAEGMSAFLHPRGTQGVLVEFVQKEE